METKFDSDRAAECAEQLNALLLILFEHNTDGIKKNNPAIGNALNLSAYIHEFFKEEARNEQHR